MSKKNLLVSLGLGVFGLLILLLYNYYYQPFHLAQSADADVQVYYVPAADRCTVLVDFQKRRSRLDQLERTDRYAQLVQGAVNAYQKENSAKVGGANQVRLVAVYINDTDNYGRPSFSSRTNLLTITGEPAEIRQLTKQDLQDLDRLKQKLSIEFLF